jgi:nucleoside-diphosphate-sugar epimerase
MRILVTGGAGYVGSVLVPRLLERGHTVRVLDRMFWGLPHYAHEPGVELVNADVRKMPADVMDGIDAVDHLAGFSNDPTSDYSPEANWQMNASATEQLIRLCRASGVRRFLFGSSCSLYDGCDTTQLADERDEVHPRGAYSTSKHYSEGVLLRYAGPDFEPVIMRQATVFGLSPRMRFDLVVNTFVKEALVRNRLIVHGGGNVWRPLVSVRDLADAHIASLEAPAELVAGEVFNVVGGNYRIKDLARCVADKLRKMNRHVEILDMPPPAIVRDYRCSGAKLDRRLNLNLSETPEMAVESLVERYGKSAPEELLHPRNYNIAWMELLELARPAFHAMDNIFEPLPETQPVGAK